MTHWQACPADCLSLPIPLQKQLRRYNYDGHKFRRIQKYKHVLFHYKDSEYLSKYLRYKILLPHHVGNEATIVKQNSDDKANHSHALMHPFDLLPWEPQRAGLFRKPYHLHQHLYPSHEKPDEYATRPRHILNE